MNVRRSLPALTLALALTVSLAWPAPAAAAAAPEGQVTCAIHVTLAESWTASKDRLTYEFVLRRGVRFH